MTRINERIRAPKIRVIYQDKNMVMYTKEALEVAKRLGLDLVEIAGHADPPVCKIIDYGKYKYELAKKKKEGDNKPKPKTKEIKFRVRTEAHDYNIKLTRGEDFLSHGDKLVVTLQFRGREMAHRELGFQLMKRVAADLETMAKVDVPPKMAGRRITMMLSPLPENKRVRKFKTEIPDDYEEEDFDDDEEDDDLHDEEAHAEEEADEDSEENSEDSAEGSEKS